MENKVSHIEWFFEQLIRYGIRFGIALLVLVGGFWLSNILKNLIKRRMIKRDVDPSIRTFIIPVIGVLLKVLVVITSISIVGFQITSFAAVLGGIAVGVGLALQGSLSNFAGGILIILFKPFQVGDYIESLSHGGTVKSISILYTTIVTPTLQEVVLPNSILLNNPIKNFSIEPLRRVDINVGISYNDDFEKAKKLLLKMFQESSYTVKGEPVTVEILEFADSSVNLAVRAFVKRENYWKAFFFFNKEVKRLFDENGINIPFPQTEMHIIQKS